MKRAIKCADRALTAASATSPLADQALARGMWGSERAKHARDALRSRQPRGAFDARAIRELSPAAPTDPVCMQRAGSSCQSQKIPWTAHRGPPDSEHHRSDRTSLASNGDACESTDKRSA